MLPPDESAVVGVGDDAAVLLAPDGRVVATTDLLIEGGHFRRDWSSASDIGAKAAAQNLADIAAMGATPTALLFGLAVPGDLAADWVVEVARGMAAECARGGAKIAGGDVTAAGSVMLAITALGNLAGADPVTRAGAKPGDVVAISGPVGRSAAGLSLLQAGLGSRAPETRAGARARQPMPGVPAPGAPVPEAPPADVPVPGTLLPEVLLIDLVTAHRRPQPDYSAGPAAAAAGATAMIDVSDGLVADLGHVADASGVSLRLQTALLPGTGAVKAAAEALGSDWLEWALTGGEDHALAATFPDSRRIPGTWTVIGEVAKGNGVVVDAAPWRGAGGWDHFPHAGQEHPV